MTSATWILPLLLAAAGPQGGGAEDPAIIAVDASRVIHRVSPYLHGACIEDVNHEIYGGLYSQLIFGESFQEPPRPAPLKGFTIHGGRWTPTNDGAVNAAPGDGPKLVRDGMMLGDGEVSVELKFPDDRAGNSGLILRVDRPGEGADAFTGYEVSLETAGFLVLGRHRRNWEPLERVACPVPVGRWINLAVRLKGGRIEADVDGRNLLNHDDRAHPLPAGLVGLRDWQRPVSFRNLRVKAGDSTQSPGFELSDPLAADQAVSGMWSAVTRGDARGRLTLETTDPLVGNRAQRLTHGEGPGEVGLANRGLNRWGINVAARQPYEGYIWARAEAPGRLKLAFESSDGSRTLGTTSIAFRSDGWAKYPFTITPTAADPDARFAILLDRPGSVVLGHALLQAGEWGRFRGLPVRKDVAHGLIDQGVNVMRYGGSMINHPQYRWKNMIGPRDLRPPTAGTWYAHSTNGWGIFDFLNFCEAAGFLAIPAVNMNESPRDLADLVEYANGAPTTPWGRRRVEDGHPDPYRLKHLEIGNEEAVNEDYWVKFAPIAEAIWAKDPSIILVVGDFAYNKVIANPDRFEGGVAVNTLAAHRKILTLARERGREVWFDIHVGTDHPPEPFGLRAERSYIDQLGKLAPGAKFKVAIFEYNSGNHAMRRALSNALATLEVERIGEVVPVVCVANCLQPDGQNDNGWDQGMLFLNPTQVWLQPPGYLTRMAHRAFQPLLVEMTVRGRADRLDANARRGDDGKALTLEVVNWGDEPRPARLEISGFAPTKPTALVEQMAGASDARNTASDPERIKPVRSEWDHGRNLNPAAITFPPRSITFLRFE